MINKQATELRNLSHQHREEQKDVFPLNRRRMVFTSGKGGVGKSTLVIQFAVCLGEIGYRTLVVDANVISPSLHVLTNQSPTISLHSLLRNTRQPANVNLPTIAPRVHFLPGGNLMEGEAYLSGANATFFLEVLAPFTATYDVIIFDTHTGLDEWNTRIMETAHGIFLVSLTDPAAIIDSYSFLKGYIQYLPPEKIGLLLNQTLNRQSALEAHEKLNLAIKHFLNIQIPLQGNIPFDYQLKTAIDNQAPFWEKDHRGEANTALQKMVEEYLQHSSFPDKSSLLDKEAAL